MQAFRPVITQNEAGFGGVLAKVLSPSRPLQSEQYLRGRDTQLSAIKQALYQPGRHVLIHGFRGVGKSSLARTVAFGITKDGKPPIVVACDNKSTFGTIVRDILDEAINRDPTVKSRIGEVGIGIEKFGINASGKVTVETGRPETASSVNEAVRLMKFLCAAYTPDPVVIVDEFDLIEDKQEQIYVTNFIKQVSDQHLNVRFLFCGIGDSVDKIMAAHGSADRYFHVEGLAPLPWEARFEILGYAARELGIEIDQHTIIRIARISDGFPYYIHFIAEKLFWRVFNAKNGGKVTGSIFEDAMGDAAQSMDMRLRGPYEKATQKYRNEYEPVLWAVADGHEFRRPSATINDSYLRIMERLKIVTGRDWEILERDKFNRRIGSLKQESHDCILIGNRQGWYEFREKMIRGYVRLRAEHAGITLEADHPTTPRRF